MPVITHMLPPPLSKHDARMLQQYNDINVKEHDSDDVRKRKVMFNKLAMQLVVRHHYLRRKCPRSWAFTISVQTHEFPSSLVYGVCIVGKPRSYSTCVGLVGETRKDHKARRGRNVDVFELKRLWLHDELPRKSESKFLGWCLRELKWIKPSLILVSYADAEQGHSGGIYKSTNWIYTGLNAKWPGRTTKHRFVWFADPKDEKLLAWPKVPYPKAKPLG